MEKEELDEFRNQDCAVHATFECNVLRNSRTAKEEEEVIAAAAAEAGIQRAITLETPKMPPLAQSNENEVVESALNV